MSDTPRESETTGPDQAPSQRTRPVIGITMGDPAGIGAEVVVKALMDPAIRKLAKFVVYGMNELMAYAADQAETEPFWWRVQHDSALAEHNPAANVTVFDYDEYSLLGSAIHQPTRQGGQASIAFLKDATAAALKPKGQTGHIDALVTAPVCKASWRLAGCKWPGHTEWLQNATQSRRSVMMFHAPQLNVVLATIHVPLMQVDHHLSIGRIYDPIDLGWEACRAMGVESPRIAVCGLNPHASEGGLFGNQEERVIGPAIQAAREHGIDARGPYPADTIFHEAVRGRFDLVVAMYHDQGLIPIKLLAFEEAVNTTLGLPLIRTSPDHGTAFDIVGRNRADPGSMKAAIRLAARLAPYGPVMKGADRGGAPRGKTG